MRENFLTPDISISGNFQQLWFWWQKSPPPPRWGEIFWHQIYPFQGILGNFGFGNRKAPPQDKGNFLTPDLSISGNFEQLWFWWQKSTPPPPGWGKFFWHQIYPFQAILSNFGFGGRKAPHRMGENFLTPDLSITTNFKQLWFWWQKSPPPHEGKFFDTRSIHVRQFWATLVLVAEKPPSPEEGKSFDTRSIHFRQFWATLVLVAEKPPSPPHEGKFFDTRSIHFSQFQATLVLVAGKPTPPPMRETFLTPDLSISGNFEQLWFWW